MQRELCWANDTNCTECFRRRSTPNHSIILYMPLQPFQLVTKYAPPFLVMGWIEFGRVFFFLKLIQSGSKLKRDVFVYLASSSCYYPDLFGRGLTRIRIILKPHTHAGNIRFCTKRPFVHTNPVNPHAETTCFKLLFRVDFFLSDAFGEFVRGTQRELIV